MELNLFVVHFPSKRNASDESQSLAMPGFSAAVRRLENSGRTRHERTIVVGDLNQHPFDTGIVGAEGLNATMTRFVAEKVKRTVDGVKYPFFYNPMWSHYGDSTHENSPPGSPNYEPPGTCYYKASESRWHYWNIYDQVLLRPELLPFFRNSDLKILIGDGVTSLLDNNGIPDREAYSDHLPVFFRLDI